MEQFSVEKYLANPSRKLVTGDGRKVKILCTNRKSPYPIVALVENHDSNNEDVYSYIRLSNTLYRTFAGICSNFPEAFESKGFEDTLSLFLKTLYDVLYSDKVDNIEEINEDRMSLLQIFSLLNDDDD